MINKDTVLFIGMLNELAARSRNGILPREEFCSDPDVTDENESQFVWYDPNSVETFGDTEYYKVIADVLSFDDNDGSYYDEERFPCLKGLRVRVVVRIRDGVCHERPFIEIKDESEEFYLSIDNGEWYEDY